MKASTPEHLDVGQLESHRTSLMRFAILQVRNHEIAEDLTQETLLAAIAQKGKFEGQIGRAHV